MIWERRISRNFKTNSGKNDPGAVLVLYLVMAIFMGTLFLFGTNLHVLADSASVPAMITPSPITTQLSLPNPVENHNCKGNCEPLDLDACSGLRGSLPALTTSDVLLKSWNVLTAPSPRPISTTSNIDFQVQAVKCRPWDWCSDRPQFNFSATESANGFTVTYVTLRIGDREKRFAGSDALLTLPQTDEQGAWLEYWAVSNHEEGHSPFFKLKYRLVRSSTAEDCYRFDVLSPDWEQDAPSGSMIWSLFPPIERSVAKVLEQPLGSNELYSSNRYLYLSGHLIRSGIVNATHCPDGGLYVNGAATPCGEQAGAEQLIAWQNRYNEQIFNAAIKYDIPARVLKGILAQESQFWPRSNSPYELGLGMFTENGADMLLTWNKNYYLSACIPMYGSSGCSTGFSHLDPNARLMMRRSVIDRIGTDSEIDVLAATLYASAVQVDQMIYNVSRKDPADLTDYETMWRITTANYYAGSGCTGAALQKISDANITLTWDQLIAQMDESCQLASQYVGRIFDATFDSGTLAAKP